MDNCKYRLPCNWCDKTDELCMITQKSNNIPNEYYQEITDGKYRLTKIFDEDIACYHEWVLVKETSNGYTFSVCEYCNAIKKEYPYDEEESAKLVSEAEETLKRLREEFTLELM